MTPEENYKNIPYHEKLIVATLLLGSGTLLSAQKTTKVPAHYKPVKSEMYRKGWIDFNKNGVKDIYEDPAATLDDRIENLLQQMTLEEKPARWLPSTATNGY